MGLSRGRVRGWMGGEFATIRPLPLGMGCCSWLSCWTGFVGWIWRVPEVEARVGLEMAFPRDEYCIRAISSHGEMYAVAAQVAEAGERPSGRTLGLSVADGVFGGAF